MCKEDLSPPAGCTLAQLAVKIPHAASDDVRCMFSFQVQLFMFGRSPNLIIKLEVPVWRIQASRRKECEHIQSRGSTSPSH